MSMRDEMDGMTQTRPLIGIPEARRMLRHEATEEKRSQTVTELEDSRRVRGLTRAESMGVNPKDSIGATKAPLGLLPWSGLVQVAEVMGLGARKYGPHNWREPGKAVQHMTYCEAALRHLAAYIDGQSIDPESGQSHLAHVAACALILLDASAMGNAVDNRPTAGVAAELMALHGK